MKLHFCSTLALAGSLWAAPAAHAAEAKADPKAPVSYYKQIRPLFQANCQGCHQPAKAKSGYVMTEFAKLLAGGDSKGKAIIAKQPDKSNLVKLITPVKGEAEMPEGKKPLHATEIETIRNWIAQGALDDTPANARARYDMDHPPIYSLPPVITSIDYSPDGQLLAVAGFHEVLLHKADGSGLAARLVGISERIESVKFSPDGKRLAVAGGLPGRMGEIQIWDVEQRKLTLSHSVTFDTVYGATWSPNGKLISFGCGDNTVRVIEADTAKEVLFMGSHSDWVRGTAWSLKGDNVISISRDMTAKLTELATQRFVDNLTSITPNALKGGIATVVRHPLREEILVGGSDGLPKLYQIFRTANRQIGDDNNGIFTLDPMLGRVTSTAFSADGTVFAAASALDGKSEVLAATYTYGTNAISKEMADVMKKIPASRTPQDKEIIAKYKASGSKTLFKISVPQAGVFAVAVAPDNKTVAAAGSDGLIRLFNATNGSVLKEFPSVNVTAASKALAVKKFEAPAAAAPKTDGEPESLPKDAKIVALEAEPKSIAINRWTDSAQILVTARLANGETLDVTRLAKLEAGGFFGSRGIASVSATGVVRPQADGATTVKASIAGKSVTIPVKVANIGKDLAADFIRDVNPVLTKSGCNQGTCHGAKDGKNGFKLSLRGYDAEYDVRAFTDELASRRANVASPDDSLMLLKPTAAVPHQGQMVFEPGDLNYRIVREWIGQGAKLNANSARVTKIELFPKNPVVQKVGSRQQMRVFATYADGSTRDVTTLAFVETGNQDVAKTDSANVVTTLRRGEAPMLARFEGAYAATTVTVMGDRSGFAWAEPEKWNKIDEFTAAKWQRMKILPSELCTDDEFIRRVFLDLTGIPPSADEVKAFLADKRPTREKRDALVDQLVGSEDYVEHWANKWADLLQVNSKFIGAEGATAFRAWIRKEVADNTPHDQFARKIITANGSNKDNPPASYYKILRKPEDTMENTTHLFLAVRFNCNKCHDHPFERWTQDQYYQTAAYFARVGLKKDPAAGDKLLGGTAVEGGKPLYEIVEELGAGEVKHDRTGKETPPQFPYPATCDETGKPGAEKKKLSRREELANWITAKDNRYFATSFANRIWGYLTGVGIIEPLDDIRAGNPPSNPELLNYLAKEFVDSGFNTRHVMKLIAKSRTYQLAVKTHQWNGDDKINFSHATARRLGAEVLYDSIYKVTGAKSNIPGVPAGTRAAALSDTVKLPDGFFATMGKPVRESACECERISDMQLGPVMALISGATVGDSISTPDNAITKLAKEITDDRQLINELFLRIMNRPAKSGEIETTLKSWATLKADHATVGTLLADYEKVSPGLQKKREETRAKDLTDSKADLAAYEKEIAPREAKLDAEQKERTAKAEAELKRFNEQDFPKRLAEFEKKQDLKTPWSAFTTKNLKATGDLKLEQEADKSVVVTAGKAVRSEYTFTLETDLKELNALRLEALTDKRFPKNGPGRAPDGNFVLNEIILSVAPKDKPAEAKKVELQKALADFSQDTFEVAKSIDGGNNRQQGWAVSPNGGATHWATYELKTPLTNTTGVILTVKMTQLFNGGEDKGYTLGRFRLAGTATKSPGLSQSEELRAVLAMPADLRTKEQKDAYEKIVRANDAELAKRNKDLADAKKPRPIDPQLKERQDSVKRLGEPLPADAKLTNLKRAAELSAKQLEQARLIGAQDLAWALINNPAFLFNR